MTTLEADSNNPVNKVVTDTLIIDGAALVNS